ncbi:MAG: hypothetical protein ACYDCS_10000 [Candidatus Dormibacteria bacterium]
MDPLGLLLEVVALAIYPGGLFVAAMAWITCRGAGLPRGPALDAHGLTAIATAVVAAAMAPLPGTPAASLPPPGGATPNLVAAVLLVVVAGSLVAPAPWSRRRLLLVAFGGFSLVLLGLVATSFSTTDISGATGGLNAAARILAAAAILVALPIVVKPQRATGSVAARSVVVAASLEVILAIVIPPAQQWPVAPLWVAGLVAAVSVYALLLRLARAATRREHLSLVAAAWLCSIAASVTAVIAARP